VLRLVNGLGATNDLELYTIFELAARELEGAGRALAASKVGSLVTALDMSGFSLTLTQLVDDSWLDLWLAPTSAPAWNGENR
jgi:phosphoenolpyruvate---glycerone phosphotransferase subunit DhaK